MERNTQPDDEMALVPPRMECKHCGAVTREQTVTAPVKSCPERPAHAAHRFEVVGE